MRTFTYTFWPESEKYRLLDQQVSYPQLSDIPGGVLTKQELKLVERNLLVADEFVVHHHSIGSTPWSRVDDLKVAICLGRGSRRDRWLVTRVSNIVKRLLQVPAIARTGRDVFVR